MRIIHVEGDSKLKNSSSKKYSMIIGRFQPFHDGHKWLINQCLEENKKVLICIRDVEPDFNNPFTSQEVEISIIRDLQDLILSERVKVMIIPDIDSVNFGRGVGYDIIEYLPPDHISEISATKIRQKDINI